MPVELSRTVHQGAPIKFTFFNPVHLSLSFPFLPNKNAPAQAAVTLQKSYCKVTANQLDDLIHASVIMEPIASVSFPSYTTELHFNEGLERPNALEQKWL